MRARITKDGDLEIQRAGKWKLQVCSHRAITCGDHCPSFGEPGEIELEEIELACAPNTLFVIEEDLREKEPKPDAPKEPALMDRLYEALAAFERKHKARPIQLLVNGAECIELERIASEKRGVAINRKEVLASFCGIPIWVSPGIEHFFFLEDPKAEEPFSKGLTSI